MSYDKHCVLCNYLKNTKNDYDIVLYRTLGSVSYTQLADHFPGFYNMKYCDYRNIDTKVSFTHFFKNIFLPTNQMIYTNGFEGYSKRIGLPFNNKILLNNDCLRVENYQTIFNRIIDEKVPSPPNKLSESIVDFSEFKPCEFKYLLIKNICEEESNCNFFENLINSSESYKNPQMSYSDVFVLTIVSTIILSITVSIFLKKMIFKL